MATKGEPVRATVPVSLHGGHTTAVDGTARPRDMVQAAEAAGLEVFGLSEHFYRPREERFRYSFEGAGSDWGRSGWPAYIDEVLAEKERAEARGSLRVLLGAEVEYLSGFEAWTREQLARWPLDYVVLSVHFIDTGDGFVSFDLSRKDWLGGAERCGGVVPFAVRYYEHVLDALDWGLADVFGHLDLVKIYADTPLTDPAIDTVVDRVLARCAEARVVLDLNARGLLKRCAEVYPSAAILTRAHAAGVEIVPGDDSHAPEQVGANLDRAVAHARSAGYERIALPPRLGGATWVI